MRTLVSIVMLIFFILPLGYMIFMKNGKYTIATGYSILHLPLATDSIVEDTIQHKITFTDLNFHQQYIIRGNYIIQPNFKSDSLNNQ